MKTKQQQPDDENPSESLQYTKIEKGRGKLKLNKPSKDKDRKRLKKERKKKRKEEFELAQKEELQQSAQVATRRRFENQSGKRDCEELSRGLTRMQYDRIKKLEEREVDTLVKEASITYYEKQKKYNHLCQTTTETGEMPCLVMSKIK